MKYLYLLFLSLFLVFLIIAGYIYQNTQKLLKIGIKTEATVIEMITVDDPDGDTYKPVFEYYDQNKVKRIYTSSMSTNPPSYAVGDHAEIIYNPDNPKEVKVISFTGLYLLPLVMLITAIPFLIIGIVFYKKYNKKNKKESYSEYLK